MILFVLSAALIFAAAPAAADDAVQLEPRVQAAIQTIDAEDALAYISYLAADALGGRNAGSEGNRRAAEWIAEFFQEMGLEGGGPDGSYFQPFTFPSADGPQTAARNVVAIWPGTDPVLKSEAVVIGAHFDHVGRHGQKSNPARLGRPSAADFIWNGADDNASGTAAVMETAQAFALARVPSRRSIVFICFDAEEHGLYGSWHYVDHPAAPLEQTAAMINLDMVGRNPDKPVMVFGLESDEERFMQAALDEASQGFPLVEFQAAGGAFGGSDHWPFLKKGVPAAFFFTGFHRDYHRITDEAGKISGERVEDVARIAFLLVLKIANRDSRLLFDPALQEQIQSEKRGRLLGIDVGREVDLSRLEGLGLPDEQGAVRVAGVYKGTVAHRAELKTGDLILSIGTVMVRRKEALASLREAIQAAPADTEVPIRVLRGSDVIVQEARWSSEAEKSRLQEKP